MEPKSLVELCHERGWHMTNARADALERDRANLFGLRFRGAG